VSRNLVRVLADRDRCVGAGQCVLSAPDVFDQSDQDGRVLILPHAAAIVPPQSEGSLGATVPPDSEGLLGAAAPPRSKGLLDATFPSHPKGLLGATVPPDSEGPLVDEAIARAAVDLCPSRALSLARP